MYTVYVVYALCKGAWQKADGAEIQPEFWTLAWGCLYLEQKAKFYNLHKDCICAGGRADNFGIVSSLCSKCCVINCSSFDFFSGFGINRGFKWQWVSTWWVISPSFFGPLSSVLGTKPSWIDKFIRTLLRATNANVIVVDWIYGSTGVYFLAVKNVIKLSLKICLFLNKLMVGAEELQVSLGCVWGERVRKTKALPEEA